MNKRGRDGAAPFYRQFLSAILIALTALPPSALAASPDWWVSQDIILKDENDQPFPLDDYAAANQGQLKNIAAAAMKELDAKLANGGAGPGIHALIEAWDQSNLADDFAAANAGQLKVVAKPFYDRLIEIGYSTGYPWTGSTTPANDYATANIGQVKSLFSFDVAKDTDGDGMPDWWETKYGFDPNDPTDGDGYLDSDGIANRDEFIYGTNPNDSDTDQDGLNDSWEIARGLNPLDPEDAAYDNGDGISFLEEFLLETTSSTSDRFDLRLTAGRAGHSFSLERGGISEMTILGSLVEQFDGGASAKVPIKVDPRKLADYKLVDQTLGDYIPIGSIVMGSTNFENAQWISPLTGQPSTRQSFVITPDRANHQFAIRNGTGSFSPVSVTAFSGTIVQSEPESTTPLQRVEAAGLFVPSESVELIDLTTGEVSLLNETSLVSDDFSATDVAVPLRPVTIILPEAEAGKSFTISCQGSASWQAARWMWIKGRYHPVVTGMVASGVQFTLQRTNDWVRATHTLTAADGDLVDFRTTFPPQANPPPSPNPQTVRFAVDSGQSGVKVREADGTVITPTVVGTAFYAGDNGQGQQISAYNFTIYQATVDLSQNHSVENGSGAVISLNFNAPVPTGAAGGHIRFLAGENHPGVKVNLSGGSSVTPTVIGNGYLTAENSGEEYYQYKYTVYDAQIPVGQTYTVVDVNGRIVLMDGFNPPAPPGVLPPPAPNYQTVSVQVGEDHYNHVVIQLGNGTTVVPAPDLTKKGTVTVYDTNEEFYASYEYVPYSATIDVNLGYTFANNQGGTTLFSPPIAPLPVDSEIVAPPAGSLVIHLNTNRSANELYLSHNGQDDQPYSGGVVKQNYSISGYSFPGNGDETWETQWVQTALYWASVDPALGYTIYDGSLGDSISFPPGTTVVDLSRWIPPKRPVQLKIAASRWTHKMEVHTANGDIYPIEKGRMQGFWSPFGALGHSDFNPNWYFDASSSFRPSVDWWVFDVDAGERSPVKLPDLSQWAASDAEVDTDLDELPDWYERVVGLDPADWDTANEPNTTSDKNRVTHHPGGDSEAGGSSGPLPPDAVVIYKYNELNQLNKTSRYQGIMDAEGMMVPSGAPIGVDEYEYDLNGNRKKFIPGDKPTNIYTYDYENRLVNVTYGAVAPPKQASYAYDYRTRRILRTEDGVTTKVVFSGGTSAQEYLTGGPTPILEVEHIRGADRGGGVGGHLYSLRAGVPSYTRYNSRGDVVGKTNASGNVTYQAAYNAFGTRGRETTPVTPDRQRANTKDEDPTGLLNEGFRYRDLETGTFITRDPAGFVDGPNLYCYVLQNPWSRFDPHGLEAAELPLGWRIFQGVVAVPKIIVGPLVKPMGSAEQADAIQHTFKAFASLPGSDPSTTAKQEVDGIKRMFTTPEGLSSLATAALIAKFGPKIFEDINVSTAETSGLDAISMMKERRKAFEKALKDEVGEYDGPTVLGMGEKAIRYTDPVSSLDLKGLSLNSGMSKLLALGLMFQRSKSGRVIFIDMKTNQIRVSWDGDHWDKFAPGPSGTRLDNAGRVVDAKSGSAHIPSTGESTGKRQRKLDSEKESK